jgi:hypothetical protein
MSYDPESCTVIYRSRMHKTLKRNLRFEHLVRYAGWSSAFALHCPLAASHNGAYVAPRAIYWKKIVHGSTSVFGVAARALRRRRSRK